MDDHLLVVRTQYPPPITTRIRLVEIRVVRRQIHIRRKSSPTSDLSITGLQGVGTWLKLSAMGSDFIFARKVLSVVGAGPRLVRTPETVLTSEVVIPVSPDLLHIRVPVETDPYPAEEGFLATEVNNCLGFSSSFIVGPATCV